MQNFNLKEHFKEIEKLEFDDNDSGNPHIWADIDKINQYFFKTIDISSLAYHIPPISFAYDHEENIHNAIKLICLRATDDGTTKNDLYRHDYTLKVMTQDVILKQRIVYLILEDNKFTKFILPDKTHEELFIVPIACPKNMKQDAEQFGLDIEEFANLKISITESLTKKGYDKYGNILNQLVLMILNPQAIYLTIENDQITQFTILKKAQAVVFDEPIKCPKDFDSNAKLFGLSKEVYGSLKIIISKQIAKKGYIKYEDRLDKPVIMIANKDTVLSQTNNPQVYGGSHWISWVLFPKKYLNIDNKVIEHNEYRLFFFDSLGQHKIPDKLKKMLKENSRITVESEGKKHIINTFKLCQAHEIKFHDCNAIQQMNGSDCAWWAIYHALMTVYTDGIEFLKKFSGTEYSALPLHPIMDLRENSEQVFYNNQNDFASINKNPALTKYYQLRKEFEAHGFDGPRRFPIDEYFVELILVHKEKCEQEAREDTIKQDRFFSIKKNRSIVLMNLFNPDQDQKTIKKILIIGRPGIGKTTLCQNIVYRWATEKNFFGQFEHLFWIRLRTLHVLNMKKIKTPIDWLLYECFSTLEQKMQREKLEELLKNGMPRSLILLDGLDEVREIYENNKLFPEKHKLLNDLFDLFPCHIVTSRPHRIDRNFDRRVENQGFKDEHILQYINIYIKDEGRQKSLQQFLKNRLMLREILKVPLNLFLLCNLWENKAVQQNNQNHFKQLSSLTGLYELFCIGFLRKYAERKKMLSSEDFISLEQREIKNIVGFFEEIAWCYLYCLSNEKESKKSSAFDIHTAELLIPGEKLGLYLEKYELKISDLNRSGLLKSDDEISEDNNKLHSFPHKTFQEFFAARYLLKKLMSKDLKEQQETAFFISNEKYNPQYFMVMFFLSGLLSKQFSSNDKQKEWAKEVKPQQQALQTFYDALCTTQVDCLGFKHILLMIQILEHFQHDFFRQKKTIIKLLMIY